VEEYSGDYVFPLALTAIVLTIRILISYSNHSVNSVNGDIAIQWEWSNFDPSQNPNPLTDYVKTLHN